jgi:hypothetical protein
MKKKVKIRRPVVWEEDIWPEESPAAMPEETPTVEDLSLVEKAPIECAYPCDEPSPRCKSPDDDGWSDQDGPIPPASRPTELSSMSSPRPSSTQDPTMPLSVTDHILCVWCPICSRALLLRSQSEPPWSFLKRCIPVEPKPPAVILLPVPCRRCPTPGVTVNTIHLGPIFLQNTLLYRNLQKLCPHSECIYLPTKDQSLILGDRESIFKELPSDSHAIGLNPAINTENDILTSQMLLPYAPTAFF